MAETRGNSERGIVIIEVDGVDYYLHIKSNAMRMVEQELDLGLSEFMDAFLHGKAGFAEFQTVLWAGLNNAQKNQATYTIEEAGSILDKMIEEKGIDEAFELISESIAQSNLFPDVDEDEAERIKKAKKKANEQAEGDQGDGTKNNQTETNQG